MAPTGPLRLRGRAGPGGRQPRDHAPLGSKPSRWRRGIGSPRRRSSIVLGVPARIPPWADDRAEVMGGRRHFGYGSLGVTSRCKSLNTEKGSMTESYLRLADDFAA